MSKFPALVNTWNAIGTVLGIFAGILWSDHIVVSLIFSGAAVSCFFKTAHNELMGHCGTHLKFVFPTVTAVCWIVLLVIISQKASNHTTASENTKNHLRRGMTYSSELLPSGNPELPVHLRIVIRTDTVMNPVDLRIIFDKEIGNGYFRACGDEIIRMARRESEFWGNVYPLNFTCFDKPFSPTDSLTVHIEAKDTIRVRRIDDLRSAKPDYTLDEKKTRAYMSITELPKSLYARGLYRPSKGIIPDTIVFYLKVSMGETPAYNVRAVGNIFYVEDFPPFDPIRYDTDTCFYPAPMLTKDDRGRFTEFDGLVKYTPAKVLVLAGKVTYDDAIQIQHMFTFSYQYIFGDRRQRDEFYAYPQQYNREYY